MLKKIGLTAGFILLSMISLSAKAAINLQEYDYVDPGHVVPDALLRQALSYFQQYKSSFPNQNYISVIDFSQRSSSRRLYVINMKTGAVERHAVAAGKGSDPDGDGYATKFSNSGGSNMSSLGIYRTAETYYGDHGLSLRLDGLSSTNSNARDRAIVMHPATYVSDSNPSAGRSWGCPAIDPAVSSRLIGWLKNGSMIYASH